MKQLMLNDMQLSQATSAPSLASLSAQHRSSLDQQLSDGTPQMMNAKLVAFEPTPAPKQDPVPNYGNVGPPLPSPGTQAPGN